MDHLTSWLSRQPKDGLVALGIGVSLTALIVLTSARAEGAAASDGEQVRERAEARFEGSALDRVDCEGYGPLCQIVSGQTVLYVDEEVRYAFIGRLYDLDEEKDLTAETLALLIPEEAPLLRKAGTEGDAPFRFDDLPMDAAITRNEGGRRKVAVFSDLHCGYCQRLSAALSEAPDIEAREFLIAFSGSEEASRKIGCARDPEAAIKDYYRTRTLPKGDCDRDIVSPARDAATAFGINSTPTFVRPDGAIMSGFRDLASLRAWIDEEQVSQGEADR
ncbi:DsbC family protein [Parvularcula sp. ZS-1/3]|uniref:Thiol:disulfide interchange protein n=1 Tax=Parvularcula mediterranea TaxID=2732508 RepID=A0A7Y3RNS6_9PROT|nr:DsbC family protein [Parvularcula mediterranea]NNU17492.1 DsbC family protein [Parvularcula mediterranea]